MMPTLPELLPGMPVSDQTTGIAKEDGKTVTRIKTETGILPTYTSLSVYSDTITPFSDGWRAFGDYDCTQLCEGCRLLTTHVFQDNALHTYIACDVACANIGRERRGQGRSNGSLRWMEVYERRDILTSLRLTVEKNLFHLPRLYVAHRATSRDLLRHRLGTTTVIVDVTSQGPSPWNRLSPLFPHKHIPVPLSPGYTSASVEGIWQALKVFKDGRGVDASRLSITTMRGIKRRGDVLGHRAGMDGEYLLPYVEARTSLYLPAYRWMLKRCVEPELRALLRLLASGSTVVLLDYTTNSDVADERTPLSHAALVKHYLEERWATLDRSQLPIDH